MTAVDSRQYFRRIRIRMATGSDSVLKTLHPVRAAFALAVLAFLSAQPAFAAPHTFGPVPPASPTDAKMIEELRKVFADKPAPSKTNKAAQTNAPDVHAALLSAKDFPSATSCKSCHSQIYEEWRISSHAYASISPMFHKFEQKINDLSQGTIGTFCLRCHSSVGTTLGEKRELALWERNKISREGITCITCHRVYEQYGRVNGERRIEAGLDPAVSSVASLFVSRWDVAVKEQEVLEITEDVLADGETRHCPKVTVQTAASFPN